MVTAVLIVVAALITPVGPDLRVKAYHTFAAATEEVALTACGNVAKSSQETLSADFQEWVAGEMGAVPFRPAAVEIQCTITPPAKAVGKDA